MNVEVVQRRLWEQSQSHRKHRQRDGLPRHVTECRNDPAIKAVWKAGCLETCTSGLGLGPG